MVGEVFAGLSALKTAFDMTQGLQNIHDAVTRDRAVIELQKEILAAQSTQAALVARIGELEEKVASFEKWDTQANRYELKKFGHGVARFLKPEAKGSEPSHPVCANCFEKREIKFLQQTPTNTARQSLGMGQEWRCPACPTKI
jgi:hypothetical protein